MNKRSLTQLRRTKDIASGIIMFAVIILSIFNFILYLFVKNNSSNWHSYFITTKYIILACAFLLLVDQYAFRKYKKGEKRKY